MYGLQLVECVRFEFLFPSFSSSKTTFWNSISVINIQVEGLLLRWFERIVTTSTRTTKPTFKTVFQFQKRMQPRRQRRGAHDSIASSVNSKQALPDSSGANKRPDFV
jgi:hypothetical protein